MLGWNQYFATIDEQFASFVVNLDAGKSEQRQSLPQLCRLTLTLLSPDEKGMSTPHEDRMLFRIESMLESESEQHLYGMYIGRYTVNGKRCFALYLPEGIPVELILNGVMENFGDYDYELDVQQDEAWSFFDDFLYPDRENLQYIMNRQVMRHLQEKGDDLTTHREVEHWIYFSDLDSFFDCKEKVERLGYAILTEAFDEEEDMDMPYRLHFSRNENLLDKSFDDNVIHLLRTAEEHDGEYDGWETEVKTD
ncbi:MAG: DUF695 domain-containing protein [Calditrichia bacterium]